MKDYEEFMVGEVYGWVEDDYARDTEAVKNALIDKGRRFNYPVRLADLAAVLRGRMLPDEVPPASSEYDEDGIERLRKSFLRD